MSLGWLVQIRMVNAKGRSEFRVVLCLCFNTNNVSLRNGCLECLQSRVEILHGFFSIRSIDVFSISTSSAWLCD